MYQRITCTVWKKIICLLVVAAVNRIFLTRSEGNKTFPQLFSKKKNSRVPTRGYCGLTNTMAAPHTNNFTLRNAVVGSDTSITEFWTLI